MLLQRLERSGPRVLRGRPPARRCLASSHRLGGNLGEEGEIRQCHESGRRDRTENLAIHHDLPGIYREVGIVEAPIELFSRLWLVGGVMIGRDVFMRERLGSGDAFSWVKDEHLLEKVNRCGQLFLAEAETGIRGTLGEHAPTGSLECNFSLKGTRSRLGRLCTNRRVYGNKDEKGNTLDERCEYERSRWQWSG